MAPEDGIEISAGFLTPEWLNSEEKKGFLDWTDHMHTAYMTLSAEHDLLFQNISEEVSL